VRQIRMLRAMRRELETGLRRLLHGHAGGNPGHSQGVSYELPRQFPTLPRQENGAGNGPAHCMTAVKMISGSGRERAASGKQVHEEQDDRNDE
jgi:hypothetical protein